MFSPFLTNEMSVWISKIKVLLLHYIFGGVTGYNVFNDTANENCLFQANSVDTEFMLQNAVSHQGLHFLLRQFTSVPLRKG